MAVGFVLTDPEIDQSGLKALRDVLWLSCRNALGGVWDSRKVDFDCPAAATRGGLEAEAIPLS